MNVDATVSRLIQDNSREIRNKINPLDWESLTNKLAQEICDDIKAYDNHIRKVLRDY